ncbi:MAG: hypothetical protein AABX04_08215 [Nanoarchaeota archaeon]
MIDPNSSAAVTTLIKSMVENYFWIVIVLAFILLFVEIGGLYKFWHDERSAGKIEEKMEKEGVSEKKAEEEEKEEEKTRKKDKKVFQFAIEEFTFLRKLQKEVNDAAAGKDLLDKAGKKLRDLKKEERLEKRMNRRIKALETEGKRLASEEPSMKGKVEEILLEIDKNHKGLLGLMAEGGEFEKILDKRVDASMTKEQKKLKLLAILQQAIHYDEEIIAATKKLGALTK